MDQCGFPRAVRAKQAIHLALRHAQAQALEHIDAIVGFIQVFGLDRVHNHKPLAAWAACVLAYGDWAIVATQLFAESRSSIAAQPVLPARRATSTSATPL